MVNKKHVEEKVIEIPREGGPFVVVEKKYFEELKDAFKAVIEGEDALKKCKTRSFREFIEEEMPEYAKGI